MRQLARQIARKLTSLSAVRKSLRGFSRLGLVPPGIWKRLPVDAEFTVDLPRDGRFRYRSTSSDGIGRALYWRGVHAWEAETLAVMASLAPAVTRVLDIGANTGVYTLLIAAVNPQARILAFEPVPQVCELLRQNIDINGFGSRCTAVEQAVSSRRGVTQLHVPESNVPTSASLNRQGFRGLQGQLIDVEVTSVDDVAKEFGAIDLCKIDVEGFELEVLAGMTATLSVSPPAIVVECNYDGPYRGIDDCLSNYDYEFYALTSRGPERRPRITPDQRGATRNYLCLPPGSSLLRRTG